MKKVIRNLRRRIVVGVVGVLILLAAGAWMLINPIAKAGVERGAGYALGVETKMDRMNVQLFRGQVVMDGLQSANPEGFETPHFFRSGQFDVKLHTGSVFSDPVELDHFVLHGLDLNVEQKLTQSNMSIILENLRRFETADPPPDEKPGRRLKINRVEIRDVVAHFHLLGAPPVTITLPVIELEDVTLGDDKGVHVSDLVARLVPAVLAAVLEEGRGRLPTELMTDLTEQLQETAATMGDRGRELISQAGGELGRRIEEEVEEFLEGVTDEPRRRIEDLIRGREEDND